mgnify:FL=1
MALSTALAHDPAFEVASVRSQAKALRLDATDALRLSPELAELVPGGCLRPGGSVGISAGVGHTSLLFRLISEPIARGAWAAIMGLPNINAHAAAECGVSLERLAFIPEPGGSWLEVTAALLDAVDLVIVNPPRVCRPTDARRLLARARQRHSVLILTDGSVPHSRVAATRQLWPEPPDLVFTPTRSQWRGLEHGHGCLTAGAITVTASGRRINGPARSGRLDLGQRQSAHQQELPPFATTVVGE